MQPLHAVPKVALRLTGATQATAIHGELQILSRSGTLSPDGAHLHIAIGDSSDAVLGGHPCAGSLVRTTWELVIGLLPEWQFSRELNPATGCADAQAAQQEAAQLLQRLPVHRHRLGPGQRDALHR